MLVIASLACGLSGTLDRLNEGKEAIETIQGVATQIGESGLPETVQAVGTQIEESGVPETMQAFATEIVVEPGEVPPDIPVMEGEKNAFFGSEETITYTIDAGFQDVLDYYQREMPARGWTKIEGSSVVTEALATLQYEKPDRKATVVLTEIPFVNQVTVAINIQ
jgi:hypothetical protein